MVQHKQDSANGSGLYAIYPPGRGWLYFLLLLSLLLWRLWILTPTDTLCVCRRKFGNYLKAVASWVERVQILYQERLCCYLRSMSFEKCFHSGEVTGRKHFFLVKCRFSLARFSFPERV